MREDLRGGDRGGKRSARSGKTTDTLSLRAFYQYQKQDGANSFRENLMLLELTKQFERRSEP